MGKAGVLCLSAIAILLAGCASGSKSTGQAHEKKNYRVVAYKSADAGGDGEYNGIDDFYIKNGKPVRNPLGSKGKPAGKIAKLGQDSVTEIRIEKSKRKMQLLKNGEIFKEYPISLGKSPVGKKTKRGDGKTPEGRYSIEYHNPHSQYYYGLKISYPNKNDLLRAKELGVSAGGDIFIHGLPNKDPRYINFKKRDWTDGCIAVSNEEISEIAKLVKSGTDVVIVP